MKANVQVHILLLLRSDLESVQSTLRVKAGALRIRQTDGTRNRYASHSLSSPTGHRRLRHVVHLALRAREVLHHLEGFRHVAEQLLMQTVQRRHGVLVVHLVHRVLLMTPPLHPNARVPLQRVRNRGVVVHVVVQRLLVVQRVEQHVEVQLPAPIVVVAHHAVPLARAVVVDLAVRAPDRNLVLRAEQERLRHFFQRVRGVRRRLRLLRRAAQQHAQLEVALVLTRGSRWHVGVQQLVQTLDDA